MKNFKRLMALLLVVALVFAMAACGQKEEPKEEAAPAEEAAEEPAEEAEEPAEEPAEEAAEETAAASITLWTYPVGGWGNSETVDGLISAFNAKYPDIQVAVEYLDYTNGDDQVNTAIEGNNAPDVILEGPERLVANWGAKGFMVDLADLWDDEDKAEVLPVVQAACFNKEGASYEYPLCMTAHCMAINKNKFEAADALQYLDLENHTWTTENFFKAVQAVYDNGQDPVGAVFCGGQGGDQGTRALINNLHGGTYTDADHTQYTIDSPENIQALEELVAQDGIVFDPAIVGGDEINYFRNGTYAMAFCWNIGAQLNTDNNEAGLTNDGDEIVCMAFPTDQSQPALCGGIWGFGIFDNGDAAKIEAAKTFIKFMADSEGTADAVKASTYFPVRNNVEGNDLSKLYEGNDIMSEYTKLMPFLGDYYQVVPGWATARTEWWNMLQRIGAGGDVATEVGVFSEAANAATAQ